MQQSLASDSLAVNLTFTLKVSVFKRICGECIELALAYVLFWKMSRCGADNCFVLPLTPSHQKSNVV